MHKNLKVNYIPINQVTPYEGNARTHSPRQIKQIAQSISSFGFINPILIDTDGRLVAALLGQHDVADLEV